MAVRSAMHHAGASALTELLQFPVPAADMRNLPCPCGHQAVYQELRSKPLSRCRLQLPGQFKILVERSAETYS
jgi:hypothetical protein